MAMRFRHTNRKGFLIGFIDFFTAGLFLLLYMPLSGLQKEIDEILGYKTERHISRVCHTSIGRYRIKK